MRSCPAVSVPSTRPRRLDRSPNTAPTKSSGTSTEISSIGSSKITFVAAAASRNASAPAIWKAKSEESTLWALPSSNVTRISTTG
ncbi:Uncharacterised protein [Mycobacterium tuberculosis]|uniref:Uncharacterized protein n=1 Tax=Mycobacterium tuberculosis TaxID=1773 RepID=A0A916PBW8_MYCTX|nr:Uncharacterised protein [Mycobacterium tuberculosis]COY65298.1 Uncharacterised protein [Mycobacterium tuberculosis]